MANNQLAIYTPEITEVFKPEVLQVIRTSICPTATDPEFLLFAHKAAVYRLDPFKNEIFFIKYGNQARIQFAAEAYLAKAREKEGFQPPDTQMVCENDEFKVRRNPETKELEVVVHEMGFPRGKIIGAYSISYRDRYRPVTVVMDIAEVHHMFSGQNKDNWQKWTHDMFGKHVEQRALKKQYGLEFGDDEMPVQQQPVVSSHERKDITAEANAMNNQQQPAGKVEEPPGDDQKITAEWHKVGEAFKRLNITKKTEQTAYLKEKLIIKGDKPTLAELKGFVKMMELEADEKESLSSVDELDPPDDLLV